MRDRIRKRLTEYRAEALHSIAVAVSRTRSKFSGSGALHGNRVNLVINEDTKTGIAEHLDQSVNFIRQVAPGSWKQYADELRDSGQKLKQEIMANTKSEFRGGPALRDSSAAWLRWILGSITPPISPRLPA
jgi:carbohydrate-selective porin OprB